MTNEEGEGRRDKIIDMDASTKGVRKRKRMQREIMRDIICLSRQESKHTQLIRGKMAAHRIKSIERKLQKQ